MNEQEKLKFLRSMGYGGSALHSALGRVEPMHGQQIKAEQKEPKEKKELKNFEI